MSVRAENTIPDPSVPFHDRDHSLSAHPSHLPARRPNALEETILLGQSVDAVVALAHCPYESAKSICLVLASVSAVLVDLCNRKLYRGVVLGLDDAVGCAALAWDVAVVAFSDSLSPSICQTYRSTSSPRSFSMMIVCACGRQDNDSLLQ